MIVTGPLAEPAFLTTRHLCYEMDCLVSAAKLKIVSCPVVEDLIWSEIDSALLKVKWDRPKGVHRVESLMRCIGLDSKSFAPPRIQVPPVRVCVSNTCMDTLSPQSAGPSRRQRLLPCQDARPQAGVQDPTSRPSRPSLTPGARSSLEKLDGGDESSRESEVSSFGCLALRAELAEKHARPSPFRSANCGR